MTSITGSTAPLHKRFDENDALRQIRSRYLGLHEDIVQQVKVLQADARFLARCDAFYKNGYKDWHILSAIINRMVYLLQRSLGNRLRTQTEMKQFQADAKRLIKGKVYQVEEFLTSDLDFMFGTHALTCLHRLGFEQRVGLQTDAVMKFLRERMRHFDLDIPHAPMFGNPPQHWPEFCLQQRR